MSESIGAARARIALTVFLAAAVMAACGGGGGGGAGEAPANAPAREQPLALSAANAASASGEALGFGGVALGLGQLAVDWAALLDASSGAALTGACAAGGTRTLALIDRDGNRRVNAGDQLTVTLANCHLKPLDDSFSGTLTIELTAPAGAQQQAGTISFGAQFDVLSGGTTVRLGGALRYDYSADRLARSVHVASAAPALTLVGISGGTAVTESMTQLDATRSVRRDTARAVTSMRFRLASEILGGTVDVSTTTPWSAWFDSFPDAGELAVTGAAGQSAQLRPSANGGAAFQVLLANAAVGSLNASDAVTPYLWSGTGWYDGAAGSALGYVTLPASSIGFKTLGQPTATTLQPNPNALAWWYSRPLAAGTVNTATFVQTAASPGQTGAFVNVPATVTIEGALLSVTPTAQLDPGASYTLAFDGQPFVHAQISDTSGATVDRPEYIANVALTISASAKLRAPALLLGPGATLALDASASTAPGGAIASMHWSQVSGPALAITGADTPVATVSALAGSGNGQAVVEVEVRNGVGDVDRTQLSFQVLADMSQALVIAYHVDNAPLTIESTVAANGVVPYVKYYPATNVVDALATSRLLAQLPPGQVWQTGTEFNYGSGAAPGVAVSWGTPGRVCSGSISGHLKVLDYAIDAGGIVTRLAIDFENACDASTTFGSIRFGSSLALRS